MYFRFELRRNEPSLKPHAPVNFGALRGGKSSFRKILLNKRNSADAAQSQLLSRRDFAANEKKRQRLLRNRKGFVKLDISCGTEKVSHVESC